MYSKPNKIANGWTNPNKMSPFLKAWMGDQITRRILGRIGAVWG